MMWLRWLSALIGGTLAMSAHVYLSYGAGNWLQLQRIHVAIGTGLIFGHLLALMVVAVTYATRLSPAFRWSGSAVIGMIIGSSAWWSYNGLFLANEQPYWPTLVMGGISLSLLYVIKNAGQYVITARVFPFWLIVFASSIYAPIWFADQFYAGRALLYFDQTRPMLIYLIGIPFALCISLSLILPDLYKRPSSSERSNSLP